MNREEQREALIELLMRGDRRECFALVTSWEATSLSEEELYDEILIPALVSIGNDWEANRQNVVNEHIATQIIKHILSYKAVTSTKRPSNGKSALLGCVPGEHHDVAALMLTNILERDGWSVRYFGASVPGKDLIAFALSMRPDLLGLTMKSFSCLQSTIELLDELKQSLPSTRIMMGGLNTKHLREVIATHVDFFTDSIREGVQQAREIVLADA